MSEEVPVAASSQPKKKKKYIQRYKVEWEWQRPWLTCRNGEAYCKLCIKTLVSERYNIERHENSAKHTKREKTGGGEFLGKQEKDEIEGKQLKEPLIGVSAPISLYADYLNEQGVIVKSKKLRRRDSDSYPADYLNDVVTPPTNTNSKDFETTANFLEEYPQDDTLIYGKVWAAEFKELNKVQRIYAKRAIDEVLYQGRLDNLSSRSWNIPIENDPLERSAMPAQDDDEL